MINEYMVKKYCNEDPTLIENYWDAMNDETQTWHCHHKNEFSEGIVVSSSLLKDIGLYYGRPAYELIFMPHSEHIRLHAKNQSNEAREKMSRANKGRTPSEETRKKISEAMKGISFSEEHKRNLSEAHKGKTISEKTRRKISDANRGRPSPNKGHHLSEETRRKMSKARKAYWAKKRGELNQQV